MLLVTFLAALVFWSLVRLLLGAVMYKPYDYRTVIYCLQSVWRVFMGVSVPTMPRTYRLRAQFMLFCGTQFIRYWIYYTKITLQFLFIYN
jgi:hypothetical protein